MQGVSSKCMCFIDENNSLLTQVEAGIHARNSYKVNTWLMKMMPPQIEVELMKIEH